MKLLIYNWAAFDGTQGGGVSVYLKRLIPFLVDNGIKVTTLSLGNENRNTSPSIAPTENLFSSLGVESFVLQGTEIPYPYRRSFGYSGFFKAIRTEEAVLGFIKGAGGFDVVHFHGIEGLPPSVLRLGGELPATNFVFTAHNYHLLCQQLQLFRLSDMAPCNNFAQGLNCVGCLEGGTSAVSFSGMVIDRYPRVWSLMKRLEPYLRLLSALVTKFKRLFSAGKKAGQHSPSRLAELNHDMVAKAHEFAFWRQYNLETIQQYPLSFITVSTLAMSRFVGFGVHSKKIAVVSPATAVSTQKLQTTHRTCSSDGLIRISFWGYSTPSKGLGVFIDAMIDVLSLGNRKVAVMIVSDLQGKYQKEIDRLRVLCSQVTLVEEYDEKSFGALCERTDLAVIGALWNETYSQVAAELHVSGVPLLASSRLGFAKNNIIDDQFIFLADSSVDLASKVNALLNDVSLLQNYWKTTKSPPGLDANAHDLLNIYTQGNLESQR